MAEHGARIQIGDSVWRYNAMRGWLLKAGADLSQTDLLDEIARMSAVPAAHPGMTCAEAQELINAYRGEMTA